MKKLMCIIVLIICTVFNIQAQLVDIDGYGQESLLVATSSESTVYKPKFNFDSLGRPHLVWSYQYSYYLKWNGSEWVDADGTGQESWQLPRPLSDQSFIDTVSLDSQDYLNFGMTIYTNPRNIFFYKWNGSSWVDVDGSGQESAEIYTATYSCSEAQVRLDSLDNPCVVWVQSNGYTTTLYYMKWNGTAWVDIDGIGQESAKLVFTDNSELPILILDSNDNPNIVWRESNAQYDLHYAKWNGSEWVDADGTGLESTEVMAIGLNLGFDYALDHNDVPHIIWSDADAGPGFGIRYLKWSGTEWVDADGVGTESYTVISPEPIESLRWPKISIDSQNDPHIVFTSPYICYLHWNGSDWVDINGSGQEDKVIYNGDDPFIKIDGNDVPCISFGGSSNANTVYYGKLFPDPTSTITPTHTSSSTITLTQTATVTKTITLTPTITETASITPTLSVTCTMTPVPSGYNINASEEDPVLAYPNPSNTQLNVLIDHIFSGDEVSIKLYTAAFRLIVEKQIDVVDNREIVECDVSGFGNGSYVLLVEVYREGQRVLRKVEPVIILR